MAQSARLKRWATVGATFSVALTIGYVMQYGDADASRIVSPAAIASNASSVLPLDSSALARADTLAPKVQIELRRHDELEPAVRVDPEGVKLAAMVSEAINTNVFRTIDVSDPSKAGGATNCDVAVSSIVGPNASLLLSVNSPCRVAAPFEVYHSGMTFTGVTDAGGRATVAVPALEVNATIYVNFGDGGGAAVTAVVPEANDFNRVVLQWKGPPAEYIQLSDTMPAVDGELRRFGFSSGDESRFAEVYTFPAAFPVGRGLQDLTVQASVSAASCGTELQAQSFNVFPGASPAVKDIRITLPECDQVGTFLELKKVLGGQTLLP